MKQISTNKEPKTLMDIFDVKESYRLPDAIMTALLSGDADKYIEKVKDSLIDIRNVFQEEQGDRKNLKQDFTPDCICELVAKISKDGSCLDMCSGTGALSKAFVRMHGSNVNEYEFSERTIPFALLDACVNGLEGHISRTDCLRKKTSESYRLERKGEISIPKAVEAQSIEKYDNVIMNPPYSMKFQDAEDYPILGVTVPKSKADYAFLLRGIEHLNEDGRLIAVLPHGVLFRGAAEGKIREALIRKHLINCVIGLPDKLFLNTSIPVCLLIIERNSQDVLFIDASKDFVKCSAQNNMTESHIERATYAFDERRDIEKYAHVAKYEEIEDNDFNLNIPRYVDMFEEEPLPDIQSILENLKNISEEERKTQDQMYKMLRLLTGSSQDTEAMKTHAEILKPIKRKKVVADEAVQMELGDLIGFTM